MEELIGCSAVLYVHTIKRTVREDVRASTPSALADEISRTLAKIEADLHE